MQKKRSVRKRPIPEILNASEKTAFLEALSGNSLLRLRNVCLGRMMLNLGLRSCEVVAIKFRHLEFDTGRLKVKGKGGKDRILWLNDDDATLLQQFVSQAPGKPRPNALVFTTATGKPIDTRFLRAMTEAAGRRAEIEKRVHPHLLRHTFASDLLRATKNLLLVKDALGHSDISTTTIYTHIVNEELELALKTFRNGGPTTP